MINTIFYFPASLNYNDYLSRLRNEELSNLTIVFAEEQLAIYFNGKKYNGIDTREFHDKIEELYNDSWIKDALDGIRGDITAANGRIDVLNGLVRDVNDSLTLFMADLDTLIESRLLDMFSDALWILRNWPLGVTLWQQGWNAEVQAYLRTVGYWDVDDYGNEITKWSKIQQSVNSISQQVNSLETNGPQSEAFSSSIDLKIDGKIAELNLGTTYAKAVDLDGTQQVIEWLYSGLKTTSSPDKTFAQLSSAGKSAVSEAVASIRTWVDKLADGTFAAGLDITAKVKNAVAGMISNVDNDGNALAALQAKADANSNDISAILLGIGGNSATADIQTRIQNVMSGFQSSSQVDGKIRQAKSSIYSALYAGTPDPITGEYDESQLISLSALKTIVDSDHSELEAITSTAGYSSGLLAKSELDSAMAELFAAEGTNPTDAKASIKAFVKDHQSELQLDADYINFSTNKIAALGAVMTVKELTATNIRETTTTIVNANGIHCGYGTVGDGTTINPTAGASNKVAFDVSANGKGSLGRSLITWDATADNNNGVVNIGNTLGTVNISGNVIIDDTVTTKKLEAVKTMGNIALYVVSVSGSGIEASVTPYIEGSFNSDNKMIGFYAKNLTGSLGRGLIEWNAGNENNGEVNIGNSNGTVNIQGNVNIADNISVKKLDAIKYYYGSNIVEESLATLAFFQTLDPSLGVTIGIKSRPNTSDNWATTELFHLHNTGQGEIANGLIDWNGSGNDWSNVELNLGNDGGTVNIHASRKWNSRTKAWSTGNVGEINIGTPRSYAVKQLLRDEITSSNYSSKVQGYNSWDALVNAGITPEINLWGDLKAKEGSDIRLEGGQIIALNSLGDLSYDSNITIEDVTFNVNNSATTIIDKWGLKVRFDYNNTSKIIHELLSPNGYFRLGNNTISNMRSGGLFVGPTVVANGYAIHNYDSNNNYGDSKTGSTKGISGIIAMSNGTTYMLICNGIVIGMSDITNVKNKFRNTYKWHQVEVWAASHPDGNPDLGCDLVAGTYAAMTAS